MNLHDFETVSGLFVALTTAVIRGFINTVPENHLASLRKQLDVRVLRRLNTGLSPIHDLSNIDSWQTITALPQKMQALRIVHLLRSLCTIQCLYIIWYILGYYRYNYRYMFHHKRNNKQWFNKNTWLDDGWPESVEEQGLLLLVWRHNFTNNIWKMCYRQSRRGVARQNSEKCKTIVCIANTFTHRRFYTQKFLHTEAFTHRSFYTEAITHKAFTHRSFYIQTLLHTDVFTHRRFYTDTFTHRHVYTQTLLHTDLFTHRSCFYTQTLWHTEAFTHRRFYTQALLHTNTFTHKHFYTQTLLHTDAFTRRRLYTQKLLHTNTFTQKHFDTQTLLHTDGFTHKRFYTQSLVHTDAFTHQNEIVVMPSKIVGKWRRIKW